MNQFKGMNLGEFYNQNPLTLIKSITLQFERMDTNNDGLIDKYDLVSFWVISIFTV